MELSVHTQYSQIDRYVRCVAAVMVSVLLSVIATVAAGIFGILSFTKCEPFVYVRDRIVYWWATSIHCIAAEGILNLQLAPPEGDLSMIARSVPTLAFGNHVHIPLIPSDIYLRTRYINHRVCAVGKREVFFFPPLTPLAIAAYLAGYIIPINRRDRESALRSIHRGVNRVMRNSAASIVIYDDQSRPTPEGLEDDRDWMRRELGEEAPWLTDARRSRSGGIEQILKSSPIELQIVHVTVGASVRMLGFRDMPNLVGATLHVHFERFDQGLPNGTDELRIVLNQNSRKRNQRLREWRGAT